jgi:hypothetical protein
MGKNSHSNRLYIGLSGPAILVDCHDAPAKENVYIIAV